MRSVHTILIVAIVASCAAIMHAQNSEPKTQELFNGKNLDGWRYYLEDHMVGMDDVWSVRDGVLVCKGEPMGYIYTKQAFKNFQLTLEYRWAPGAEPGNSGVLMRINGKPMPLPRCLENQLAHGKAGDLYGFHGMKLGGEAGRLREVKGHALGGDLTGVGRAAGAENKPGEWNKVSIVVKGGTIKASMNDKLVNEAVDAEIVAGPIGLQSEGGEIHFRNISITPLAD